MKKIKGLLLGSAVVLCVLSVAADPVRVIFDTDMITDFDDVGAQ